MEDRDMIQEDAPDYADVYDGMEESGEGEGEEKKEETAGEDRTAPKYTKQQLLFIQGKNIIAQYRELEKRRPLTDQEKRMVEDIKNALFEAIYKYGMKLATDIMRKYRKPRDAYKDIQASLAVVFSEKLDDYDPYFAAPTTFFKPYFLSAISDYLRGFSQNLSQYDAANIAKVRQAKYYFQQIRQVTPTESMIANYTGLSIKVVKQTLKLESVSIYADVDDMISLKSDIPGPDKVLFDKERREEIFGEVEKLLTPQERQILEIRLDLEGESRRPVPYQDIADELGLNVRQVKQIWSSVIAKLGSSPVLQSYRKDTHPYEEIDPQIEYHSSIADQLNEIFASMGYGTAETEAFEIGEEESEHAVPPGDISNNGIPE